MGQGPIQVWESLEVAEANLQSINGLEGERFHGRWAAINSIVRPVAGVPQSAALLQPSAASRAA